MSNIVKHIISLKEKLPVYSENSGTKVKGYISKGEWLGVIAKYQSRLKIISSKLDGWVNPEDCASFDQQMDLLTSRLDEHHIRYYVSV